MERKTSWRVAATALLGLPVIAGVKAAAPDRLPGDAPSVTAAAGMPSEGWQLSATLDKVEVPAGEPVTMTVTARNVSDHALNWIAIGPPEHYIQVGVEDRLGHEMPLTRYGAWASLPVHNPWSAFHAWIHPGRSASVRVQVSLARDMTITGKYTVTASRVEPLLAGKGTARVVSNPVTVSVT